MAVVAAMLEGSQWRKKVVGTVKGRWGKGKLIYSNWESGEMSAHHHTASWVRAGNFHPGHLNFRPCDLSVYSTQHNAQPRAGIDKYLSNVK